VIARTATGLGDAVGASAPGAGLFRPAAALAWREIVRFLRQRNRVIGALLTPVVFWLFIGAGIGSSFRPPEGSGLSGPGAYLAYFFPGALVMVVLFTAIFSTISVIEDRREGFLQSVLVSPAPRLAIALGKVAGGSALAGLQGGLFLAIGPLAGIGLSAGAAAAAMGVVFLLSIGLTAMGFCLAWWMNSTQGFHAIMNLLLMPMWFLSGALFPIEGAARPVQWLMYVNPLTYGVSLLRQCMGGGSAVAWWISLPLGLAFTAAMLWLAAWSVERRRGG